MATWGQPIDQARRVTVPGGIEEGPEQSTSLRRIDRAAPLFSEMLTSPARQLPRVGFADLECVRDLAERVVEGLVEHVDGTLDRDESFHQELDGDLECLAALDRPYRIDGGRIGIGGIELRQPAAGTHLATGASRGGCVERGPRRDGDQERDRIPDLRAVRTVPADPHVLDDVLGVGGATHYPVGDPEQPGTDALEVSRGRPIADRACGGHGHRHS
jgi:hypothetical protein